MLRLLFVVGVTFWAREYDFGPLLISGVVVINRGVDDNVNDDDDCDGVLLEPFIINLGSHLLMGLLLPLSRPLARFFELILLVCLLLLFGVVIVVGVATVVVVVVRDFAILPMVLVGFVVSDLRRLFLGSRYLSLTGVLVVLLVSLESIDGDDLFEVDNVLDLVRL